MFIFVANKVYRYFSTSDNLLYNYQGCSLGLDVSVSRRSRDAFSQRLGLGLVSVSGLGVSFTSDSFLIKANKMIFLHSNSEILVHIFIQSPF